MRAVIAIVSALFAGAAGADDARAPDDAPAIESRHERTPYKLSAGGYRFDARSPGFDLNLRRTFEWGNAWLGNYHDPTFGSQTRAGADANWRPFAGVDLAIQPSLQIASRGFAGASVSVEYGVPWFVSAGLGRTNLRPYWNLNFDPNDAVAAAVGYRGRDGHTMYLQLIRDDRLGTGQQHLHAVLRLPLGRDRLTIDVLRKQGAAEGEFVRAWGIAIGYDAARFFIRIARDPRVNFSADDVTRLVVGTRF